MRKLPIYFLIDNSGSMKDNNKMYHLNNAIRKMILDLQSLKTSIIEVCVISFSRDAKIEIPLTNVNKINYNDILIDTTTCTGKAIKLCCEQLELLKNTETPIIILCSDGQPTDFYDDELKKFLIKFDKITNRFALGIGSFDKSSLLAFVSKERNRLFEISDSNQLAECFELITKDVAFDIPQVVEIFNAEKIEKVLVEVSKEETVFDKVEEEKNIVEEISKDTKVKGFLDDFNLF